MSRRSTSPREQDEPSPEPSDLGLEQFGSVDDEDGLSLEELSRAYAQLMTRGDVPYAPEEPAEPDREADTAWNEERAEGRDPAAGTLTPRTIVEAILFVGHPANEPLNSRKLATLMRGVRPEEIDECVAELNATYQSQGRPYRLDSSGPGYRLVLRDEYFGLRDVFYRRVAEARLSQAAVDVLAIVAYRPGIARRVIDRMRGRPSGHVLSSLVRRGLLRVEHPSQRPRTSRYYTTDRFLDLYGLETIADLPRSPDFDSNEPLESDATSNDKT